MKHFLVHIFALPIVALLFATSVQAATEEKMVVALKTSDFELAETDISNLAVGEAQTIETDSGTVIDILRTADGTEIYVDGELLETNFDDEGSHGQHKVKKHVEIICHDEEDCDNNVFVIDRDAHKHSENIVIHKEIELSCDDNEEGARCTDKMVWVSDGEDVDIEELHEMHEGSETHKIIVIKKQVEEQD